jgi:cellulose synthase/poly-beta-1,6-N-acetylglucosamine synthase-like glycosyltransferase
MIREEIAIGSVQDARKTFVPWQTAFLLFFLLASVAALIFWTKEYLIVLVALITVYYIVNMGFKIYLTFLSLDKPSLVQVSEEELKASREWPAYTIAVPLYKEANVLPELVQNLEALDYPKEKLQIILLLEEDDEETIKAAGSSNLPGYFELLVLPPHQPRTKPYAVNEALRKAEGEFFVIYDAEDRPEADQLKKAIVAFSKVDWEKVVCLQSRLEYWNPNTNLLTRWFAGEYASWFNLTLPGIAYSGKPVPLGGTSNHFPTKFLKSLGGWDAYNVTEDCELGMRIARLGKKTLVLDTITWEEANCKLGNWIRQRSRWTKGFMQTYLVYMRNPVKLFRDLGWVRFLNFQILIGGTPFCLLVNPFFWAISVAWVLTQASFIEALFPNAIYYLGMTSLVLGNFIFIYLILAGVMFRQQYSNAKYMLLVYAYWILMSVGAYKALFQLLIKPSYWEKTKHGLVPINTKTE